MGRIGKQPIKIPQGVTIKLEGQTVIVNGPKGQLTQSIRPEIKLDIEGDVMTLTTTSTSRSTSELHGVSRTLIANMVAGVTDGWSKTLEVNGTGYRAAVTGKDLTLNLGFSHPVVVTPPNEITFVVKENKITVSGIDKAMVGQVASQIRKIRPPDPYKAKGIKYAGEVIRRKAGKAAKTAGAK